MCVFRVLMYGEKYVFGVADPDEGKEGEEGEVEGWGDDMENAEVGKLLPVESALIRRIRVTKFKLMVGMCTLPPPSLPLPLSLSPSLPLPLPLSLSLSPSLPLSLSLSDSLFLSLSLQEVTRREERIAAGLDVENRPLRQEGQGRENRR